METAYTYDSKTFRLTRLLTERGTDILQDFEYAFDPQGNITTMNDNATQTLYYNNNIIDADRAYTYDALYRLAVATGREHINQPGTEYNDFPSGIALPHPNDPQAMRRYSRSYEYDNSGNMTEMDHTATGANWTRDYTYSGTSNRLTQTQIGSTPTSYSYDAHGNIQSLPNVTAFTWDFQDQVKEADLGGGGTAYYTYNAEGQRIRKVIHNNSDIKIKETIYLDGYEVYHEFVTGNIDFERQTLHVMSLSAGLSIEASAKTEAESEGGMNRIALTETKTIENGTPVTTPVPRIRYQHSDHLGSCSVETSDTGTLISFEEYYPYGGTSFQSTSSSSQVSQKRYRYNGKEKDEETNLYYFGARYYISWLGRWMNCDPIGEEGSGLNLYRYASNNPVMRVDPTGMKDMSTIQEPLTDADAIMEGVKTLWNKAKEYVQEKLEPGRQSDEMRKNKEGTIQTFMGMGLSREAAEKEFNNRVNELQGEQLNNTIELATDFVGGGVNKVRKVEELTKKGASKIEKLAKELLGGKNIAVDNIKEADAVLKKALPDAKKIKGAGSEMKSAGESLFKGKESTGMYKKEYQIDPKTGRVYGHSEKNIDAYNKHINIKLPDGTKVNITIKQKK